MESEQTSSPVTIPKRRLWFGVVASGFAWFGLGAAEMFITWRACLHNEQYGNAGHGSAAMIASFAVSFLLLGLMALAGFVSYRTWRRLSSQRSLIQAEGRSLPEFVALVGLFFSLTLGAGMVWMTLPLFLVRLCARVR